MSEQAAEKGLSMRIARNSPKSFLLGASWSHDRRWPGPRLTHVYLGPWLMTVAKRTSPPAKPNEEQR